MSECAKIAAKNIIEFKASGKLTNDIESLAKYIDTECGIDYLVEACKRALLVNEVDGETEKIIRGALAWAGVDPNF